MRISVSILKYSFVALLAGASLLLSGCNKDDDNSSGTPAAQPMLHIDLSHLAGVKQFILDSTYTTASGDQFTPSLFKYYISNIRLVRTDNSILTIPDTYFLINQDDAGSRMLELDSLPEGDFKAIQFVIGVDSTRNCSGAQDGALDPGNGMFWTWNTGYIFLKLEGTSPSVGAPGNFRYHVGGYKGIYNNIRDIELDFDGDMLSLVKGGHPELHLVLDVLEIFETPTTIDMSTFSSTVMSANADAQTLANNYIDMFTYSHIHAE